VDWHEPSEVLSAENLDDNNDGPDNNEGRISGDTSEDVNFVIDLSRADHVEHLHEHEQVEHNWQVTGWSDVFEWLVHWSLLGVLNHTLQE